MCRAKQEPVANRLLYRFTGPIRLRPAAQRTDDDLASGGRGQFALPACF